MEDRKSRIAAFIETIGAEGFMEQTVLLGGQSWVTHASKNGGNCINRDFDTCNASKNRKTCQNAIGICRESKNGYKCKSFDPDK